MKDYVSAMFIYVTNNFYVFVGYFKTILSWIMFFGWSIVKLYILLSLVYKCSFITISTPFKNTIKKRKNKSDPFWTRIRYWIRSIHGSGSGSCKIGPVDQGPNLDPVLENRSKFGSRCRSDPLSFLDMRDVSGYQLNYYEKIFKKKDN